MNFLIIEDDLQKAERIRVALRAFSECGSIETCQSYQSGLRRLTSAAAAIDAVILDMSLPTFDPDPECREGIFRSMGGYDLMSKLKRARIEPRVVVLTALGNFSSDSGHVSFDEMVRMCASEFPAMFFGAVHYSLSGSNWIEEVMSMLRGRNDESFAGRR